jgi:hypothetical protein
MQFFSNYKYCESKGTGVLPWTPTTCDVANENIHEHVHKTEGGGSNFVDFNIKCRGKFQTIKANAKGHKLTLISLY